MRCPECGQKECCGASLSVERDRYREALEYFAALRGDTLIIDINRRAQRALQRDSDDMSEM